VPVGIGAHKATLSVAVAEELGQPVDHERIRNNPEAVRKLVRGLDGAGTRLVVAYEAGPTGYALHRQFSALGVESQVTAPSMIPARAGDRA
jgi:transposase